LRVESKVEVTTKLCTGYSASGPIDTEATYSYYRGYKKYRTLSVAEIDSFPDAHFFQELYYLADSLERGDFDYIGRMEDRLSNWRNGAFETLADAASQ